MGNTRAYIFITGPETATLPSPGTPTADGDFVTLGYAQGAYAQALATSWNPGDVAPVEDVENAEKVWLFEQASAGTQKLVMFLKVPQSYVAGEQIKLWINLYSPSTSNTILLKSTAYLVRENTDAVSSTTNSHVSTNAALTNASANRLREASLDVTNASGQVNSVAVSAGDLLRVELYRGTDTDTADIRFIPSATEARYA